MKRLLILALLVSPIAAHANVTIGTNGLALDSDANSAADQTLASYAASGDPMLVLVGSQGNAVATGVTFNSSESLTKIGGTTASGNSADMYVDAWCLYAPTATTANVVATGFPSATDADWMAVISLPGTQQTSCAAMTELAEDVDDAASTNQSVFSTAGTAGNLGIVACSGAGADSTPASNNAGFTELHDTDTLGGANNSTDIGIYVAHGALPDAVTVTMGDTDEHACVFLSIAAEPTSNGARARRVRIQAR